MILVIFLTGLMGSMFIGVPIAFALMVCGVSLMFHLDMFDVRILAQTLINGADSFALMAVPFFLLVGELMNAGGISKRIIGFGMALVGHIRGGLGYVAIIAAFIFAGLSGSAVADAAALCAIMVPMMSANGYSRAQPAALIGASGIVAMILPPSIALIVFGAVSGVSIVKLFMAGIVPGMMLSLVLAGTWWYLSRKNKAIIVFPRKTFPEVIQATKDAGWALALPFLIIFGIRFGVVTPTEAAVVAVFYTLFLCMVVYRTVKFSQLTHILITAARSSSVIMFLIAAAMVSAWMVAIADIPAQIANWLAPWMGNKLLLMVAINLLVLAIGTSMDLTPTVLILTPMLMPIVVQAGIDPVYFGVVFILNGAIGLLTPPVGSVLNAACGAGKVSMDELVVAIFPFLVAEIGLLALFILVPELITVPMKWFF